MVSDASVSVSTDEDVFAFPASDAQRRLWLIHELDPRSPAYNVPLALRLRGKLDRRALARTLDEILRRHEVLRTTFATHDGDLVQVVAAQASLPLPLVELRHVGEAARDEETRARALRATQVPFSLSRDLPIRAELLCFADGDHSLLLTLHHIVADDWSLGVLLEDLATIYGALVRGSKPELPELPIQYGDFAVWQSERLAHERISQQALYWRRELEGAPPILALPIDKVRPATKSDRGASRGFKVPPAVTAALVDLARQERATLFIVLASALDVVLGRHARSEDIVIGSPVAGRRIPEVERLVGFFANMIALRTDLAGDPTFRELVRRVRDVALRAFANDEVPFEKIVDDIRAERTLGHSAIFQVVLGVREAARTPSVSGLRIDLLEIDAGTARYELTFQITHADTGELDVIVNYTTDLFDAETAARLGAHLGVVLETAAANPDRPIGDFDLRSERDLSELARSNATNTPYPSDACVDALFSAVATASPNAEALSFGGRSMSYGELDARSTRLARHLQRFGVGVETRVALCAERSIDMIVGMLAVLKTGAAYVPLDHDYPRDRLEFMLEDARVPVLLTQEALEGALPVHSSRLVFLDDDSEWADASSDPIASRHDASCLAYVMYTSGSTGRPKGVAITHRSIVRLLFGTSFVPFGPTERIAHASSPSFDAATLEIWGALLHGGCVVGIDKEIVLSPRDLSRELREQRVTTMWVTTGLFNQIAREMPDAFSTLRCLLFGGQAVDPRWVREVLEAAPPKRLVEGYGPTETTTFATTHEVHAVASDATTVPIGTPISNTTCYVLDHRLRPLPFGVPGELFIGGPGLARGYLERRALTASRCVPDPFHGEAGARMYRTGDLVRWTSTGIEFLGRLDGQIKLRGFRIELGEVEAALSNCPGVAHAAATLRESATGDARLVGYVVIEPGADTFASDLRDRLGTTLPEYMIPSAFVFLDDLPLNPNGKVDRAALPAPEGPQDTDYVPPRTATEQTLSAIWSDVLGVEPIGAPDDFFNLGGHSLLATQVVGRIREAFGVEIALRSMFENPTLEMLAECIDDAQSTGEGRQLPPIERVPRGRELPVSFAQERLWFLDKLLPNSTMYNVPAAFRLRGELDVDALERTLAEIVRRHEVLRTRFEEHGGRAHQIIERRVTLSLDVEDLSAMSEPDRDETLRRLTQEQAFTPFDLGRAPLVRAKLVRLAPDDHALLWTMHHIVSDGGSLLVLIRELSAIYDAYRRGEPSPLPELEIQYADYAVWQRQWLSGEELDRQVRYWRTQLAGVPPVLDLPLDRPRPPVKSDRGGMLRFEIPQALAERLRATAQEQGATTFMALLAALQIQLGRYARRDDIVVGSPIAGRRAAQLEGVVGFFVNTLVLRADLSGDPTFRELLARVQTTTLDAYAHQDLPFEKLVEELHPDRNLSITPIFQVALGLFSAPDSSLGLSGLKIDPIDFDLVTAKWDLAMQLFETTEGGLGGGLEYSTDLFDRSTAERIVAHYVALLASIVADPDRRITELEMRPESERAEIDRWNRTETDYPSSATVHALFAEQAASRPDDTAVVYGTERLTYGELRGASTRLARYLRRLGVRTETKVGICLERSPRLIVGLLGILEAGGAYVPLDPDYPISRLAFMVNDAGVSVVLTDTRLASAFDERDGLAIVRLDADQQRIADEQGASLTVDVEPTNLAYVTYTSGSTGMPKGVAVTHRSVVRLLFETSYIRLGPTDRIAQASVASFDAATFEIWGALLYGGCVVGIDKDVVLSPRDLARELRERGVTTMFVTTGLFNQIASEIPGAFSTLRCVLFGGQAVDPRWVREVLESAPPARLVHVYGPTETTTFATWNEVGSVAAGAIRVPLGIPISNTTCHAVDVWMRPVSMSVPGELSIGGPGVARGYLARPGLTAEKFVPDPFAAAGGARMYRTGDVVSWTPRGIEFLGRLDGQVKLRGYRIEVGEVEVALLGCAGVDHAAVALREDTPGDARLVAYVVASAGRDVFASGLRDHLRATLPEYMIPSAFVFLDALPLNANGKVDRAALPAPEGRSDDSEHVPPRTPTEKALCTIWAEILGVEPIGALDDFFNLGGHSLLVTQLVGRLRDAFGVEVAMREVFENPTVGALAQRVDRAQRMGRSRELPPIERTARSAAGLPLSFAQERLWFLDRLQPGPAYNMPIALRLVGPLDVAALETAIAQIVSRHEALRTRLVETLEGPVQMIEPAGPVPLERMDLGSLPEAERLAQAARHVADEASRPFDLSRAPLLRVHLVTLSDEDHVALFVMHHVVSDGWSIGVLVKEIGALYEAAVRGEPAGLPDLAIQYGDYAAWQRSWLAGEELERQLAYWRDRLRDAPPLVSLPTDRPRPRVKTGAGDVTKFSIPAELTAKVAALCARESLSPFMVLLSAFEVLVSRATGETDVIVGSPVANRRAAELEPLVGFFVNMLTLRTDLSDDPTFRELLSRVRETCLEAYAHQDLPFEKLVEDLSPVRAMSSSPLFQIVFAVQNMPMGELRLGALTWTQLAFEWTTSKYDIAVSLTESDGCMLGEIEFDSDIFERATIDRFAARYVRLLGEALDHPESRIDGLALDVEEQRQLLRLGQPPAVVEPTTTIATLFEAQVDRTPDAVAIVCGDEQLSYRELDSRANRLARRLEELPAERCRPLADGGVGPEVVVAICADRSAELVVAMLAVLKAGGAYLPLDPELPIARLSFMLEDSGARVLLAGRPHTAKLRDAAVPMLALDDAQIPGRRPDEALRKRERIAPSNLAYVIYTSGSTGQPKGVCVPHRGLTNLVEWVGRQYHVQPADRMTQVASASFDAMVWETWPCLASGGSLLIASDTTRADPHALARWIAREGATTSFAPTPLAEALFDVPWDARVALRCLQVAGDKLHRRAELHTPFAVDNLYGPTEASVCTTRAPFVPGAEHDPPIGGPIANTSVYVLDGRMRGVARGAPGELFIGGAGVARGYLRRAALTAERFVPDPFADAPGERLYRSGDLVRWLESGQLGFLGRVDEQVKVRGFRVELGEIEVALESCDEVRQAVVVAQGQGANTRLVGYFTSATREPEMEIWPALEAELEDELPAFSHAGLDVLSGGLAAEPEGERHELRVAPIAIADDVWRRLAPPALAVHYLGRAFDRAGARFAPRMRFRNIPRGALLASAATFEVVEVGPSGCIRREQDVTLPISVAGPCRGFVVWADASGQRRAPLLLPVFDRAVDLAPGDVVRVTLRGEAASPAGSRDYELRGEILTPDGRSTSFHASSRHACPIDDASPFATLLRSEVLPIAHDEVISPERILAHVARRLPAHMVPTTLVELEQIPLTAHGKIDRRELRAAGQSAALLPDHVAPRTPVEQTLARVWQRVLDRERVGVHDDFFELGGNSLLLVQLTAAIRAELGVDIAIRDLFEAPTIESCARALSQRRGVEPEPGPEAIATAELARRAMLDATHEPRPAPMAAVTSPSSILLTGATGFIGAFLLREILDRTGARLVCLVRARTDEDARLRLRRSLQSHGVWDDAVASRVAAVASDLAAPRLGLSDAVLDRLAADIDAIFHNGAQVGLFEPYSALEAANVGGTRELLRLASIGAPKVFHYVSTISVFPDGVLGRPITERDALDHGGAPATGYAQTKWVAEKLVWLASDRGLSVTVHRPGLVTGHRWTGVWTTRDWLSRFVRGCVALGAAPSAGARVAITPVDFVSRAIAHLAMRPSSIGRAFHLVSPETIETGAIFDWLRERGHSIEAMSWEDWMKRVAIVPPENPLYPLVPVLAAAAALGAGSMALPMAGRGADGTQTLAELARARIHCPAPHDLLPACHAYFVRAGLLAAPGSSRVSP